MEDLKVITCNYCGCLFYEKEPVCPGCGKGESGFRPEYNFPQPVYAPPPEPKKLTLLQKIRNLFRKGR